jgi:EAL domain-containing protein (putative c-di-GMP-specific phosphodiesterase class I)
MGVNISPVQLQEEYFTDTFFDIMEAMEVPSKWIDIEITESIALSGILNSTDVIERMKQKGITISVDDFGTGYETFANMIYFEFNRIKIAKELVDNIAIHPNAGVIVGAIISMAKGMNLDIIAEGVEEETQLEVLTKLGCDQMQGFYFGKPVPADEFEKTWLK